MHARTYLHTVANTAFLTYTCRGFPFFPPSLTKICDPWRACMSEGRDWDELGENDTLIVKLQAIGMVLAYLKIFSFLQFFSEKIDDFITSLSHSKSNLISYATVMTIFIISFSVGIHLAFGVQEFQFSSLPLAALSLAELLFGNFDAQPLNTDQGIVASMLLVGQILHVIPATRALVLFASI